MPKDKVSTYYKRFLIYYYPITTALIFLFSKLGLKGFPKEIGVLGVLMGISAWIIMYIEYKRYKKNVLIIKNK